MNKIKLAIERIRSSYSQSDSSLHRRVISGGIKDGP